MFCSVDDDALTDLVGQMHGVANASTRLLLAGVVEIDQRELWRIDAATSTAAWLEMSHGVSRSTANEWVRTSRALVYTPTLAQRFHDGHLSWDQLQSAIDLVAFGRLDERAVAADAVGRTAAELDRMAREARRLSRKESLDRFDREFLQMQWDRDGMLRVHGRLGDVHGKAFENIINRLADRQPDEVDGRRQRYETRTAAALFELASAGIACDADPDRATVVVHLDAHALAADPDSLELAKLELGPVVSLATAHRLACDGRCQVVVDDLLGRTVEVAKTVYTPPRWMRRRVLDRDGGCRWPGCARTALLHTHHIVFFGHGGATHECNLVALCWFHHHAVHEGGWKIHGDPRERLTFTGPQGQTLRCGPPGLRPDVGDALGLRWADDPPVTAA